MRLAYELSYPELRGLGLDAFPIAFNGDDCVARMDLKTYKLWLELLAGVGWKLSPGKSYFHKHLAQVNSQTMPVIRVGEGRCRYVLENPIPFVNEGFMQQMGKATCQIDETPLEAMSRDWRERWWAFERLPMRMGDRARRVMLDNLQHVASELARNKLTPFVFCPTNPVKFGGFGIPGPFNQEVAKKALEYERPPRTTVYATCLREEQEETEPWLVPRERAGKDLLEELLDDLVQYVEGLRAPSSMTPGGYVDLEEQVAGLRCPSFVLDHLESHEATHTATPPVRALRVYDTRGEYLGEQVCFDDFE